MNNSRIPSLRTVFPLQPIGNKLVSPKKPTQLQKKTTFSSHRRITSIPVTLPNPTMIFITGGIGDVFALESYLTDEMRNKLTTICYATRQQKSIMPLFADNPSFPLLKNHITVWNDFSNFWAFHSKQECERKLRAAGRDFPNEFVLSDDWSIAKIFPQIQQGKRAYNQSSFLKRELCTVPALVPDKYVVICPCSTDKHGGKRDFSVEDWDAVLLYLSKTGRLGVILNNGQDIMPKSHNLIDLSNKTTMFESIEILKHGDFYIGIDSCLSILAARHFPPNKIMIKSTNTQFYNCEYVYCAPHKVRINTKVDFMELDSNSGQESLLNQATMASHRLR